MRWLMWFSLGFGGACALGAYLWVDDLALGFALGFLMLAIAAFFLKNQRFRRPIGAGLLGIALGLCWFRLYDGQYLGPLRSLDGQTIAVEITASDFGQETNYGTSVDGWLRYGGKPYKVRLYLYKSAEVAPGDVIRTDARLRLTTDGGAREPTWHRTNGIWLLASQKGDLTVVPAEGMPWYGYPALLRQNMQRILENSFPEREAGFARALLLGQSQVLDSETSEDFRVAGISHLVAVSGLHVSILFAMLCVLTGRRRFLLLLIGAPILLLFAAVAGFTPSVNRAVTMQILILLANVTDREYDPPTSLAAAALVMLVCNPLVIASVGFQLSVSSVAGIFLFSDRIRRWFLRPGILGASKGKDLRSRVSRWVATTLSITLGATVMTTPLIAYDYGAVSLVGPVTNLLVMWCISGIFYGLLLVCGLGALWLPLGKAVALVLRLLIDYVLAAAHVLAKFPLAAVYTESVYLAAWLVFWYVLLILFSLSKKRRVSVLLSCGAVGLCAALLASWLDGSGCDYRVTVLDVGQGQCILIQQQGNAFLVDCGGEGRVGDLAADTLLCRGIFRLDGLILTHFDEDHAGGAADFLSRIPADAVYVPGFWENAPDGTIQYFVDRDVHFSLGEGNLTIFAPEFPGSNNESSLAVLYGYGGWDLLIMGDRTALAEKMLLERGGLPDIEVLVVGHHGSDTSTRIELLDATRPETAVISVGADNRYGHPKQEVLDRLEEAGCIIRRTDLDGTIEFRG